VSPVSIVAAQQWQRSNGRSNGREGGGAVMVMAAQQRLRWHSNNLGSAATAMAMAAQQWGWQWWWRGSNGSACQQWDEV
jgi:hypothetical protein